MIQKLFAIIEETIREARARKTLIGFFLFSSLLLIIALLVFQLDAVQSVVHKLATDELKVKSRNGQVPSDMVGATVLDYIWTITSHLLFFMTVLIGVFSTSGLITSIMEKGTIDLLLSKPVPRWLYVVGRYLGSVLIMMVEVVYFTVGLWIIAGFSFGTWSPGLLVSAIYITIGFAGLFAVVTFIGVLTRSSWFAIILGMTIYFITGLVIPLGQAIDRIVNGVDSKGPFTIIADIIHWSLPQLNDIASNMGDVITGKEIAWLPLLATTGLSVLYLGLASWSFSKKEF